MHQKIIGLAKVDQSLFVFDCPTSENCCAQYKPAQIYVLLKVSVLLIRHPKIRFFFQKSKLILNSSYYYLAKTCPFWPVFHIVERPSRKYRGRLSCLKHACLQEHSRKYCIAWLNVGPVTKTERYQSAKIGNPALVGACRYAYNVYA